MPRTFRHLSFATVASAIALFVALSGGTAFALSKSDTEPSTSAPATDCAPKTFTISVGAPDRTVCTVGSLTVLARCTQLVPGEGKGELLIASSAEHAFVASELDQSANLGPADPPVSVAQAFGINRPQVNERGWSFEASEAPAAGRRHIGGTVAIRARFRPQSTPPAENCQFAVDAVTS